MPNVGYGKYGGKSYFYWPGLIYEHRQIYLCKLKKKDSRKILLVNCNQGRGTDPPMSSYRGRH